MGGCARMKEYTFVVICILVVGSVIAYAIMEKRQNANLQVDTTDSVQVTLPGMSHAITLMQGDVLTVHYGELKKGDLVTVYENEVDRSYIGQRLEVLAVANPFVRVKTESGVAVLDTREVLLIHWPESFEEKGE